MTYTLIFLLCLATGTISGTLLRKNEKTTQAASENITVGSSNQVSTIDQGTPTITRTSVVTVKDSSAIYGYTLSAKLSQNTLPSSTVAIGSASSDTCTLVAPCALTTAARDILRTTSSVATGASGDTTSWTVTMTVPANTTLGNYILDIEYGEAANPPQTPPEPNPSAPTTYGAMQTMTNAECSVARGNAFDARNDQIYYVQKIGDLCWMETNLRYAGGGNYDASWGWSDDRKSIIVGTTIANNIPQYHDPRGSTDYTNTAANGGFYGYLYNWCAAMGGQANACGYNLTGYVTNISICPAGWHLPTGEAVSGDFTVLNNTINSGSGVSDTGLRDNFLAVYSGLYDGSLRIQGSYGYIWSSTVNNTYIRSLHYRSSYSGPVNNSTYNDSYAVRCVL